MKGYYLYHDKEFKILEIGNLEKKSLLVKVLSNEITTYNNSYYVCNDRKKLKEFAEKMKNEWIKRAETELVKLKEMKIKNKY